MVVRLALIAVLLVSGVLSQAQNIMNPARIQKLLPMLDPQPSDRQLQCYVTPIKPALNYSFRFQVGYEVRVPMRQYQGTGHRLAILIRITPDADREGVPGSATGRPVYLGNRFALPNVPTTKVEAAFGGVYLLGEGGYSMKWIMTDDLRPRLPEKLARGCTPQPRRTRGKGGYAARLGVGPFPCAGRRLPSPRPTMRRPCASPS